MRRKKRSSFPFISLFVLCILLFALLGLVQSKDTSALISVLQEFLPEPSPTASDDMHCLRLLPCMPHLLSRPKPPDRPHLTAVMPTTINSCPLPNRHCIPQSSPAYLTGKIPLT